MTESFPHSDSERMNTGNGIIFVGGGGHALSLAEFCGDRVIGYIAHSANPDFPYKWLGDDSMGHEIVAQGFPLHIAYIYSGSPLMLKRKEIITHYQSLNAKFATVISPQATITPQSEVGEGSAVMCGAIINRAKIGKCAVINSGAIIEHDCKLGDNTFIGPGAVVGGFTEIGNNITIGDNITVAMGAVINKDLTEPGIYHGNPLRLFPIHKIRHQ